MDLSSTFKTEVYRPIVTIVIPGLLAFFPVMLYGFKTYSLIHEFADKHEASTAVIVLLIVIAIGLIFENIGSWIEHHILDNHQGSKEKQDRHIDDWYKYLRLAFKVELIGHRYLRTITLRMKFELSFAVSIIFSIFGFIFLYFKYKFISGCYFILFLILSVLISFYLFWEALHSSRLLNCIRHELLKGVIDYENK